MVWHGISAISGRSATFQALTTSRRESGLRRISSTTQRIWSISLPSPAVQRRHCLPYTGPSSPRSSAHSSQMVTLLSRRYAMLVSPFRNHSSRSEEHTSELQSREKLVCRRLLEKKKVRELD